MDKHNGLEDDGPFNWPDGAWILLVVALLGTLAAGYFWTNHSQSHYRSVVTDALWTTFSLGNPNTVSIRNVQPSLKNRDVLCGRINYEKFNNQGWSGYTDFFMEKGVIYITPTQSLYWPKFKDLCLTTGVDRG